MKTNNTGEREWRDGWGQAEKAPLSREEGGEGKTQLSLGRKSSRWGRQQVQRPWGGIIPCLVRSSGQQGGQWDRNKSKREGAGDKSEWEKGPWPPGHYKNHGFGTDLRRAWSLVGTFPWGQSLESVRRQRSLCLALWCSPSPSPSGRPLILLTAVLSLKCTVVLTNQAPTVSEGSFSAEIGSGQKALVKSSLCLCHLSLSRWLSFLGS